jgi:hypothetical protein
MTITITRNNVFILLLFVSCATASIPLRLQDRALLIDPQGPNLIYPYMSKECKHPRRRIFKDCDDVRKIIKYDMRNQRTREKLIAAGFQCTSRMRFDY